VKGNTGMIDWRDIPSERELDKRIAISLGWRVERWSGGGWNVYDPKGFRFGSYVQAEDALEFLPFYSTDANAPLPIAPGTVIEIQEMPGSHYAARFVVTVSGKAHEWRIADTLAEARVRAWLDGHSCLQHQCKQE